MLGHSNKKLFSGVLRTISTTSRISASHYDVLGVTPKCTQSDIKSAYYKLSKLYHPDTSKDEESAKKFRAITEAYEVLGNIKLKKMYDKGLLVGNVNTTRMDIKPDEDEPTDPTLRFYKSRQTRNVVPTMDGRQPIYDFDTWSKHHYGNLLKKNQYDKDFLRKRQIKREETIHAANQEIVVYVMMSIMLLFVSFMVYGQSDYDLDKTEKKNKPKLESANNVKTESVSNS